MTCHNDQECAGDLSLEMFLDPKTVAGKPEIWAKVHDVLTAGPAVPGGRPLFSAFPAVCGEAAPGSGDAVAASPIST